MRKQSSIIVTRNFQQPGAPSLAERDAIRDWALRLIAVMPMHRADDPEALVAAWRIAVAGFDPRDMLRGVIAVAQGRALDIAHPFAPSPPELARAIEWEIELRLFRGDDDPGPWLPPGDDEALAQWAARLRIEAQGQPSNRNDMALQRYSTPALRLPAKEGEP
jgi:hypothetical protein